MSKKEKIGTEFDKSTLTYLKEIGNYPSLTQKEEYELWKDYKYNNNNLAKEKLLKSNLKFVANVARSFQGRGLSYADLIAEGNLGLLKALDKFDGEKGFKLISYAVWWIRQSIREALKERGASDMDDIPDANISYEYNTEIEDTEDDIVTTYNIIDEDEESNSFAKEKVGYLMNFLSEKEKFIINCYWGLNGDKPMTLEDIGEELGLTKERVRQISVNSFKKMRSFSLLYNE